MARVDTFRCGHPKVESNCRNRGGGYVRCKKCHSARQSRWHKKHPENSREGMLRVRRKRIALLLKEQNGCCAICEELLRHPYLDHNHKCCPRGTKGCEKCRRGLLCPDCNTKLAALEKPGWLEKARAYLDKWKLFAANHNVTDGSPAK